ncbi:UNVERIFIED_CONTAM: hypothetical protein FKN15_047574 [Acipenser sinensis]
MMPSPCMDSCWPNSSDPSPGWTGPGSPLNSTWDLGTHADYDDEFLHYLWREHLFPKLYEWVLIVGYIIVFVVALAGNILGKSTENSLIPGTAAALARKWVPPSRHPASAQQGTPSFSSSSHRSVALSAEIKQLRARRKTAKMLLIVLLVFAFCYLPISVLNILKRVFRRFENSDDREAIYAWFTFSHWLVYANSAANPIIYNFLSGKFREEFKTAFSCCFKGFASCRRINVHHVTQSTSQKSLTANSKSDNVSKVSEHVILTRKFREEFKTAFSCCFKGFASCRRINVHHVTQSTSQKSLTANSKSDNVSKVSEHVILTSVTTALS